MLTADELDAVRRRLREQAAKAGVGTDESQRPADAVARLARGRGSEPERQRNDGHAAN